MASGERDEAAAAAQDGRRAIVVAGMHRSGTSAVTRVMALLGADLPARIGAPASDNEPGFWEPIEIVETHERLLRDAGSSWDDVAPISKRWFATAAARRYEDELLTLLESNYGDSRLFVLKDPRICRLAGLWLRVLERFEATPLFVLAFRNPLEVAESLQRRDGFGVQKSQLLWLRYILQAERSTRGHPRTFVSFDRLLLDWIPVAQRIAADLGLTWAQIDRGTRVEIDRFLSPADRHHERTVAEVGSDPDLQRTVKRLHELLLEADQDATALDGAANRRTLDRMLRRLDDAHLAYGALLIEERVVAAHQLNRAEADAVERLARSASDAAAQVQRLERELADRAQELADRAQELGDRERELASARRHGDGLAAEVTQLMADTRALRASIAEHISELELSRAERIRELERSRAEHISELELSRAEHTHELERSRAERIHELELSRAEHTRELEQSRAEAADTERRLLADLSDREQALIVSGAEVQELARLTGALEQQLQRSADQLHDRAQAIASWRARAAQLASKLALAEGERDEGEEHVLSLQGHVDAAARVEEELRGELALAAGAIRASDVRLAAMTHHLAGLQSDLFEAEAQLHVRTGQFEAAVRESTARERELRADLALREQALAASDASVSKLSAALADREAELSLRAKDLRQSATELQLARARLQSRPVARIRRGAQAARVATAGWFGAVAAAWRRWWTVASWYARPQTRPLARAYLRLRHSDAFDADFYLANYRDVARSGMDPLLHYIRYGVRDRYDPSRGFSTTAYLVAHPDLDESRENPLVHALAAGTPATVLGLPAPLTEQPAPLTEQPARPADDEREPALVKPTAASDPRRGSARGTSNAGPELLLGDRPDRPLAAGPLAAIPRGAVVLVASGSEQLTGSLAALAGYRTWRLDFGGLGRDPATASATTAEAVRGEIEKLRAKGAGYLVFADSARSMLVGWPELRDHLAGKYRCIADGDDTIAYELTAGRIRPRKRATHRAPGWSGLDVICLPIIDWNYRFQRPQQLVTEFAKRGHRVFYVATTFRQGSRRPAINELADNVWGVRLPGATGVNIYTDVVTGEVTESALAGLDELRREAGIGNAMVIVDLPFWGSIALESRGRWGWKVLYDCMDEHGGFVSSDSEDSERLRKLIDTQERSLLAAGDLVIATSRLLHQKASALSSRVLLVPNAADFEQFSHADRGPLPASIPRPVLGYYGAISSWFDSVMIGDAARLRPDWSFVLAGRTTGAELEPLAGLPNVHFLGELPYEAVPGLLHQFDVACLPFHRIDLTLATNPVKFYEYMSAGKPLVSVELPELEQYADYFYAAHTGRELVTQAERALVEDCDELRQRRVQLGRENTWTARYRTIETAIRPWYEKATVIVTSFNNPDYLQRCLDSLQSDTHYPNFDVIIVDNGSDQPLIDEVVARSEHEQNLRLIAHGDNLGFARANNLGIEAAADAEYIVLLNDDTVVTPGWLGRLIGHLQDESIGIIGPVTNWSGNEARIDVPYKDDLDGLKEFAARRFEEHRGALFDIPVLAMYCVAVRKRLLDELGRLDERFAIGMFEDDDFALRVRGAGKRVVCAEDVFIHHWGRASFRRMSDTEYESLFDRNREVYEQIWKRPWVPHRGRDQ